MQGGYFGGLLASLCPMGWRVFGRDGCRCFLVAWSLYVAEESGMPGYTGGARGASTHGKVVMGLKRQTKT